MCRKSVNFVLFNLIHTYFNFSVLKYFIGQVFYYCKYDITVAAT